MAGLLAVLLVPAVAEASPAPPRPDVAGVRGLGPSGLPDPPSDVDAVSLPDQPGSVILAGGALWVEMGSTIGRLVPGQALRVFPLPTGTTALSIAADADGAIWFGGFDGSLGMISTTGVVSLRSPTRVGARFSSLVLGRDGAIWATTTDSGGVNVRIERLDASGASVSFSLGSSPFATGRLLAAGPGAVLLVEGSAVTAVASDLTRTPQGVLPDTPEGATASGGDAWFAGNRRITRVLADGTIEAQAPDQLPAGRVVALRASAGNPLFALMGSPGQGMVLARAEGTQPASATALPWYSSNGFDREVLDLEPDGRRLWLTASELGGGRLVPIDPGSIDTTVTVSAPDRVVAGVTVTFEATALSFAGLARSGRITFYENGRPIGSAALNGSGTAQLRVPLHGYGGDDIVASYERPDGQSQALSPTRHVRVDRAETITTLQAPHGPWRPGRAVSMTVTVTSPDGPPPTGTLTLFREERRVVAGAPVTFTVKPGPGYLSFRARFMGDGDWTQSESTESSVVVRWDDAQENYVEGTYVQIFGRVAANGSRIEYARRLRGGLTRTQFATELVATPTYRLELLRRAGLVPESATLSHPLVAKLATTPLRTLQAQHLGAQSMITSCQANPPPFFPPGGTFDCWLYRLYQNHLGRMYTPAERAAAGGRNNTVAGRTATAKAVLTSTSALESFVAEQYLRFGRPLPASVRASWVERIRRGASDQALTAALIATPEWFARTQF